MKKLLLLLPMLATVSMHGMDEPNVLNWPTDQQLLEAISNEAARMALHSHEELGYRLPDDDALFALVTENQNDQRIVNVNSLNQEPEQVVPGSQDSDDENESTQN